MNSITTPTPNSTSASATFNDLPSWVSEVGARSKPPVDREFLANQFGALGDGETLCTKAIQDALNACREAGGGTVRFEPGQYVTGALFLGSDVHLLVGEGVTLLGSQDDADYPKIPTRVAGIEMEWPAALLNINDACNVQISGGGVIDGRGEQWWDRYWALRNEYTPRGLRWASDYDCARPRLIVVWQSEDVTIDNLHLKRSGFWTVQIVYCEQVTLNRLTISDNSGPSTDGLDIDSSRYVLISNCDIDNNDDDICLKAGRDADGLRVNLPTEYVFIHDNLTRRGGGVITFGSETSGGIRHVVAYRNRGLGTNEGVRFKSASTRGGVVEDILIRDLALENVPLPFVFRVNWNPTYSYAEIPEDMADVPDYWHVMAQPVLPPERGYCELRNITIENVEIRGAKRLFSAAGFSEKPLQNVRFRNIDAQGQEAGSIDYARDWTMENVTLTTKDGAPVTLTNCVNVPPLPTVTHVE